ncbi:MAG: site-specific DNA-methyltransferase [Candidatus Marinimicrobia bacterium]|nr:site-specific DNA-methyltransferase [Candidatus Neomarinimicrobiota bacterium]MBT4947514.1 site-specific DNA-methyltransferase [Candidatus Neomarinimicrobiota bacterium]
MRMIELHNMDCMDYMKGLEDNAFDLAIVDPPYGIETRGNAQDRFAKGMQLKTVNDDKPNQEYFYELFRISKNQVVWGYNHLSDMLPSCREFVFWYKHQPVVTFSDGELAWTSFQKTAKCFDYPYHQANRDNSGKIHPTQKPVKLYHWLLENYAEKGQKILDTHLGSGSSAIAAHYYGVDFVGIELDEDYFKAAKERIDNETRQESLF